MPNLKNLRRYDDAIKCNWTKQRKSWNPSLQIKPNQLLANYSIFYQNTRGYHWNIKGEKFFELHLKFEELYNNLLLKIDEIAERILTLGHAPDHKYSTYHQASTIKESTQVTDGIKAVGNILESFEIGFGL